MIFNGIKISAAKKKIARLVEEQSFQSFSGPAKSLGIIVDAKNEYAIKVLTMLKNKLSISEENLSIFYYSQNRIKPQGLDAIVFNLQDFDNKAAIANDELLELSGKGIDLLITFAAENNTVAHLLTATFKAGIKVGRFQQNAALYDLILQTEEDEELFVEELLKYLKNLKKGVDE
jgi:hypothetical protein